MHLTVISSVLLVLATTLGANAEQHIIRFNNLCGRGTPTLVRGGKIMSTGADFVSNGPFESAIAYLQDGNCLLNGEHCTLLEMNMNNPACPGCGSSVDISLIDPHALNVPAGFKFFGGDGSTCDGLGAFCGDKNCDTAFFKFNDNQVQRACQSNNVNLLITFCGGEKTGFTDAVPGSLSGGGAPQQQPPKPQSTSAAPANTVAPATTPKPAVPPATTSSPASNGNGNVKPPPPNSPPANAGNTPVYYPPSSVTTKPPSATTTAKPSRKTCKVKKGSKGAKAKRAYGVMAHARSRARAAANRH